MTAIKEANQGFAHKIEPCVLCSYSVDFVDISDLATADGQAASGVEAQTLACPWFSHLARSEEPPSWHVARRLMTAGVAGILVPSYAPGATSDDRNLVLWRWGPSPPHAVSVDDPSGRLPQNQLSWK